VITYSR